MTDLKSAPLDYSDLPGADLVQQGLCDLGVGITTEFSLLLLVVAPRLEQCGIKIPQADLPRPFEHKLYALLEERYGVAAFSRYNSLVRRAASFVRAFERELRKR